MSGYFSYYNDKVIDDGANLDDNAHLYNDPFKTILDDNNEGRRCLFFSINSKNLIDPSNIIGMNDSDFNVFLNDANNVNNINNFASIYSRTLVKKTTTNPTSSNSYWNIFNGSFINGVIYADNDINQYETDDRIIFSLLLPDNTDGRSMTNLPRFL